MPLSIRAISEVVASYYNVDHRAIASESRSEKVIWPRFTTAWFARWLTHYSLPHIGMYLGRDHTTILHEVRRAEERRLSDPGYAAELEEIGVLLDAVQIAQATVPLRLPDDVDPFALAEAIIEGKRVDVSALQLRALAGAALLAAEPPEDAEIARAAVIGLARRVIAAINAAVAATAAVDPAGRRRAVMARQSALYELRAAVARLDELEKPAIEGTSA
jgi:hypothetical protein